MGAAVACAMRTASVGRSVGAEIPELPASTSPARIVGIVATPITPPSASSAASARTELGLMLRLACADTLPGVDRHLDGKLKSQ